VLGFTSIVIKSSSFWIDGWASKGNTGEQTGEQNDFFKYRYKHLKGLQDFFQLTPATKTPFKGR
jgi:hypothetical protein